MWQRRSGKKPGKLQSLLVRKLLTAIEYLQQRWTTYMSRKAARLTSGQRKACFFGCCLVFALVNGCVMYQALTTRQQPVLPKRAARSRTTLPLKEQETRLSDNERQAIINLRHRLDSLAATPEGRAAVDSFVASHQGFIDSLLQAEAYLK